MKNYSEPFRAWKIFDIWLFVTVMALCVIGLISIAAAGQQELFQRQLFSFGIGLICFFGFSLIDYRSLKIFSEGLYGFTILLLIMVINIGYEVYGAQRWISFQGFSFQPSEIAKLALIIAMAKFLEQRQAKLNSIIETIPGFILVGVPFLIIYKQPDLGTAIVLVVIFLIMSFWAGMRLSRLFLLASPLLSILILYVVPLYPWITWLVYLALIFVYIYFKRIQLFDGIVYFTMNVLSGTFSPFLWNSLSGYQKSRLVSFINPDVDPLARGVRYHTVKSLIAVGSGGWLGKGFMQGPLTNLQYIPQQHTDFIFSIIGEEFGLVGSLLVVGLILFVCYRLIVTATQANTVFGTLLAIGVCGVIMFQSCVNIGMNIGLVPVVGIPLPFISYGGTSLVMLLSAIGIVQSIAMRRRELIF